MSADKHIYRVRILSGYDQWWRYNAFLTVAGYDAGGKIVSYKSITDKIYDIGGDASQRPGPPAGYRVPRTIEVESDSCSYIDIYFYAIANTFPESTDIKDSPPFEITVEVEADGKTISGSRHEVNQWGGITIAGLRVVMPPGPASTETPTIDE